MKNIIIALAMVFALVGADSVVGTDSVLQDDSKKTFKVFFIGVTGKTSIIDVNAEMTGLDFENLLIDRGLISSESNIRLTFNTRDLSYTETLSQRNVQPYSFIRGVYRLLSCIRCPQADHLFE
jgi:hypothetical protein